MKKYFSLSFYLLLVFSCGNNNESKPGSIGKSDGWFEKMMPIVIYFQAYDDLSGNDRSGLKIEKDSVIIFSQGEVLDKIATDETEFERLFSVLTIMELSGPEGYRNPYVMDGGVTRIVTPSWEKTFMNAFAFDFKDVVPDSIGLTKFKKIADYAGQLTREQRMKEYK